MLAGHIPDKDATVVARLAEAGAVLLGKLNLTEGAMGGYNPQFEAPLNPWNPGVWSGASSQRIRGRRRGGDWPTGLWEATQAGPSASRPLAAGSWA